MARLSPRSLFVPAPFKGLDFRQYNLPGMPETAVLLRNLQCSQEGLKTLKICTSMTNGTTAAKTLICHLPSTFFTVRDTGITAGLGVNNVIVYAFGGAPDAGVCWPVTFTTAAGTFTIVCNGLDVPGLYNGAVWAGVAWTGVTPTNVFQALPYRGRLYLADRTGQQFWYLPPGAVAGAAVSYNCGSLLSKAGPMVAMATLSKDSGNGPDDFLVCYFSSGELIVFSGNDPSATDWHVVGVYQVGQPKGVQGATQPYEPRCLMKFGGDLLVATITGVHPLSALISRGNTSRAPALTDPVFALYRNFTGAVCLFLSTDEQILFVYDGGSSGDSFSLMMDLRTGGWSEVTDSKYHATSYVEGFSAPGSATLRTYGLRQATNALSELFRIPGAPPYATYDAWAVQTPSCRLGQMEDIQGLAIRPQVIVSSLNTVEMAELPHLKAGVAYDMDCNYNAVTFDTAWKRHIAYWGSGDIDLAVVPTQPIQYHIKSWKTVAGNAGSWVAFGMSGAAGQVTVGADDWSEQMVILGWDYRYQPLEIIGA